MLRGHSEVAGDLNLHLGRDVGCRIVTMIAGMDGGTVCGWRDIR
jgi:hypothetical protein